ncbi:hypothetical protein B5F39_06735 [Cloacibacillus sp. An23]|nr:hypothetical protein B5F39_06735 [Cloacibacillus sp. An23]
MRGTFYLHNNKCAYSTSARTVASAYTTPSGADFFFGGKCGEGRETPLLRRRPVQAGRVARSPRSARNAPRGKGRLKKHKGGSGLQVNGLF